MSKVIRALLESEELPTAPAESSAPNLGQLAADRTVLGAEKPASTDEPVRVKAGDTLHGLIPEAHLIGGYALARGDEMMVTAQLLADSKDRNGDSAMDDLSESAQVRRWGQVRLGIGPWPRDEQGNKKPSWLPGDPVWAQEREKARRLAWAEVDPAIRQQKLARVREIYGDAATSSKTLNAKVW